MARLSRLQVVDVPAAVHENEVDLNSLSTRLMLIGPADRLLGVAVEPQRVDAYSS